MEKSFIFSFFFDSSVDNLVPLLLSFLFSFFLYFNGVLQEVGHVRIRQHVNPLRSNLMVNSVASFLPMLFLSLHTLCV